MSKDFIVFDPTELDLPAKEHLLTFIHEQVGDGEMPHVRTETPKIRQLIAWAAEKYGAAVDESSLWSLWPPVVLANGRYCTFNLSPAADSITFMMIMSTQCQKQGLILIDPSGNEPFITIPTGGGLLD